MRNAISSRLRQLCSMKNFNLSRLRHLCSMKNINQLRLWHLSAVTWWKMPPLPEWDNCAWWKYQSVQIVTFISCYVMKNATSPLADWDNFARWKISTCSDCGIYQLLCDEKCHLFQVEALAALLIEIYHLFQFETTVLDEKYQPQIVTSISCYGMKNAISSRLRQLCSMKNVNLSRLRHLKAVLYETKPPLPDWEIQQLFSRLRHLVVVLDQKIPFLQDWDIQLLFLIRNTSSLDRDICSWHI